MSKKKQNTPSKNTAKYSQVLSDTCVAKYPEIFDYFNNYENNKKHLMLSGGNKKELPVIRKYIFEEIISRELVRQDSHDLVIYKKVDCFNKSDVDLHHKICEGIMDDTKDIKKIIQGCNSFLPNDRKRNDNINNEDSYDVVWNAFNNIFICERYLQEDEKTLFKCFELKSGKSSLKVFLTFKYLRNIYDSVRHIIEDSSLKSIVRKIDKDFRNKSTKCEILSLDDITSKNNDVWRNLAISLNQGNSKYKPNLIVAETKNGENVSDLPDAFTNMFKVISLDSADHKVNEQEEKAVVVPVAETAHFPTPSDSEWGDVRIYIRDNEYLKIDVKKVTENVHRSIIRSKIDGEYIGLECKKSRKPTKLWELLKVFASFNGELTSIRKGRQIKEIESGLKRTDVKNGSERKQLPKRVERLNSLLIKYFRIIPGKPIPRYNKKIGYKPAFQIEDISYQTEHEDNNDGFADD